MPEEILMKFVSTRLAFFRLYLVSFILLVVWFSLFFDFIELNFTNPFKTYLLFLPLIGIILITVSEIRIREDRYFISNYRIVERKGLISTKETSLRFDRIANYSIRQNFLDKILNTGTIEIESVSGTEGPEIVFREVSNVKNIKMLLDKMIVEWRGRTA